MHHEPAVGSSRWSKLLHISPFVIGAVAAIVFIVVKIPGGSAQRSQTLPQIRHPQQQFRVWPKSPDNRLRFEKGNSPANLVGFANRIESRQIITEFANKDTGRPMLTVDYANIDRNNNILLADLRTPQLIFLTPNGVLADTVSPDHFKAAGVFHPRSIYQSRAGTIYIGDLSPQVSEWAQTDERWNPSRAKLSLTGEPLGICSLGSRLYLHATPFGDSATIYPVNSKQPAFGVVYRSGSDRIDYSARQGKLVCAEPHSVVWVAEAVLNEFRVYREDGSLQWLNLFEDARSPEFTQVGSGTRTTVSEAGFHRVESLVAGPGGIVLIQLALITSESRRQKRPYDSLQTFLVDSATGQGIFVSSEWPLVRALGESMLVVADLEPETIVRVYRY